MRRYQGKLLPGEPYPLGATYDGQGVNFALFSEHAAAVKLCFFEGPGSDHEPEVVDLEEITDHVWHVYIPGIRPGQRYGYRIDGPWDPGKGDRFHPGKLLIDPYARAIEGRIAVQESMYDYNLADQEQKQVLNKSKSDSGHVTNRSIVTNPAYDWEGVGKPRTPMHNSIIYELHVKGFTATHPAIPPEDRGTFRGLTHPAVMKYFRDLGITAIELMPVHHFVHRKFLLDKGLTNYWGYDTIGFFAPHAEYSASGMSGEQVKEFKDMVKAYHKHGIEVILDVVYNHTGEGNHLGPSLAFRGIDNHHYYRKDPRNPLLLTDYTGTGNTLNLLSSRSLQLVMDSLRYWATEMQVDGFRFDLASSLARGLYDVGKLSTFLDTIHQDPVISRLKLIAEPWDLGEGGYQVGNFPVLWAEWNGKYRDSVRQFWRGDERQVSELAYRLSGSSDLYADNGKHPSSSINFITAHDGFTLHDLVSYNRKHNRKNGEQNRDGEDHNLSWNSGAEGETDDPEILDLREKRKRSFLATLLLSQGVPMISHGDEYGRTQLGNNNVYCQDNETAWMDWDLDERQKKLLEFTRRMIAIRKEHPITHRRRYFKNRPIQGEGVQDIRWLNTRGEDMSKKEWETGFIRCMGMLLNGELMQEMDEYGNMPEGDILLVLVNSYWESIRFTLPNQNLNRQWELLVNTGDDSHTPGGIYIEAHVDIPSRSLVLLKQVQAGS